MLKPTDTVGFLVDILMKKRIRNFKDVALDDLKAIFNSNKTLENATNYFEGLEYDLLKKAGNYNLDCQEVLISSQEADRLFLEKQKAINAENDDLAFDKALFYGYVAFFCNKDKSHKDALLKLINKDCRDHVKYIVDNASSYQKIRSEHLSKSSFFELYSDQLLQATEVSDFIDDKIDWVENRAQAIALIISELLFVQNNLTTSYTPPALASNASIRLVALLAKYNVSPFAFRVILPFIDAQANGFATQLDSNRKCTQRHFYSIKKLFTFISSLKISCNGDYILPFLGMSSQACFYIAQAHMTGNMLPFNPDVARLWMRISALMGNPLAYYYDALMNNSVDYNSSGASSNFINEIYFALSLQHYANSSDRRYIKTFLRNDGKQIDVHDYLLYNLLVAVAKKCIISFRSGSIENDDFNIFEYSRYGIEAFHILVQTHNYEFAAPLFVIHSIYVHNLQFVDEGFANAVFEEDENYKFDNKDNIDISDKIRIILYTYLQKAVFLGDVFAARILILQDDLFKYHSAFEYNKDCYLQALILCAQECDSLCYSPLLDEIDQLDKNHKLYQSLVEAFKYCEKKIYDEGSFICVQSDISAMRSNEITHFSSYLLKKFGSYLGGAFHVLSMLKAPKAIEHTLYRYGQWSLEPSCRIEYDKLKESGEYNPLPFVKVLDEMCDLAYYNCYIAEFLAQIFEEGKLVPRNPALSHYYGAMAASRGSVIWYQRVKKLSYDSALNFHNQFLTHKPIWQTALTAGFSVEKSYHEKESSKYAQLLVKLYKAILKGKTPFEAFIYNEYINNIEQCFLLFALNQAFSMGMISQKVRDSLDNIEVEFEENGVNNVSFDNISSLFCMRDLSSYTVESYLSEKADYNIEGNSAYLYLSHLSSLFTMAYSSMLLNFKIKEEDELCQAFYENLNLLEYINSYYDCDNIEIVPQIHFMLYRLALRSHVAAPNAKLAKFCLKQSVNCDLPLATLFEDQDLSVLDSVLDILPKGMKVKKQAKALKKAVVVSKVAQ